MRHFVILKGLLSRYFKRTHLMAVKMMGILIVLKSLKKTGQIFFFLRGVPFLRRSKKLDPTSLRSLFMPQKVRSNKSKETTGATKHCDVYQSIRTIYPLFCLNKRWILLVARKCFTSEGEKSNSSRMLKTRNTL